jgi:hypothetical protein
MEPKVVPPGNSHILKINRVNLELPIAYQALTARAYLGVLGGKVAAHVR